MNRLIVALILFGLTLAVTSCNSSPPSSEPKPLPGKRIPAGAGHNKGKTVEESK